MSVNSTVDRTQSANATVDVTQKAGLGKRAVALIVDSILLGVITTALTMGIGFAIPMGGPGAANGMAGVLAR